MAQCRDSQPNLSKIIKIVDYQKEYKGGASPAKYIITVKSFLHFTIWLEKLEIRPVLGFLLQKFEKHGLIFVFFKNPLSRAKVLRLLLDIPVLNKLPSVFLNARLTSCRLFCTACIKKLQILLYINRGRYPLRPQTSSC